MKVNFIFQSSQTTEDVGFAREQNHWIAGCDQRNAVPFNLASLIESAQSRSWRFSNYIEIQQYFQKLGNAHNWPNSICNTMNWSVCLTALVGYKKKNCSNFQALYPHWNDWAFVTITSTNFHPPLLNAHCLTSSLWKAINFRLCR